MSTMALIFLFSLIVHISCSNMELSKRLDRQQMVITDEETFEADLKNFIENGEHSEDFDKVLDYIRDEKFLRPQAAGDARFTLPLIRCAVCRGTLAYLLGRRRFGDSRDNLARSAIFICQVATSFSQEVCEGLINLNIDVILFVVDSRPNVNQKSFCALILQQECGNLDESLNFQLNLPAESTNPSPIESIKQSSSKDIKIIQFTDIHFDPLYVVGGNADCNDPLCCRKTATSSTTKKAGYWGDYRKCDTPWHTVEHALKHIAKEHSDADIIYYTGDSVPHNVWETSIEGNTKLMDQIYKLIKETFASKAIYPILGNHEEHPVNVFAPSSVTQENFSSQWLYNYTATIWSEWLPKDTIKTILQGGYYTALIKPGFRVIALNNNECYIFNWWILFTIDDIVQQLKWLQDILLVAEQNNEKVHILAHIASGEGSCFKYWSREYRRIIERFYKIISAQFNGHSHYNEFNVFYAAKNISNPISVAWNGGSITTYYDVNPNYNVYLVDGETFQVKDIESWIFNLTEANQNSAAENPRWYKQYSFKNNFDIPDLSMTSLDKLLVSMTTKRSLAKQYFQYKIKDGEPFLKAGCQDDCLRNHVCQISINEIGDDRRCKELLKNSFTSD